MKRRKRQANKPFVDYNIKEKERVNLRKEIIQFLLKLYLEEYVIVVAQKNTYKVPKKRIS